MQRIKKIYDGIYFSLPIQLVIVQVRYQKFILISWVFLFMVITGNFGERFGIPYLFLAPEYMGEVNFYSNFLLGIGMGTFTTVYMIASYISNSYRFHFLALEHRPFFIFIYNNIVIPLIFTVLYIWCFLEFKIYAHGAFEWWMLVHLGGIFLGFFMVTIFILLYFFGTNRTFVHEVGEKLVKEMKGGRVILEKARLGMGTRMRIDYFLSGLLKINQPNSNEPADFRKLVKILNQNHGNALFLELILLITIMGLGLMEQNPFFQLPAATSVLLFLSMFLMLVTAFTFWFRRLGPIALVLVVVLFFTFDRYAASRHQHPALGMNYEIAPVPYSPEKLYEVHSKKNITLDIENTLNALNHWRADYQLYHGPYAKPRAVIICTSGGGLRSGYFTTRVMQQLDSLSQGRMMNSTRLITGASGGMIGAAYFRELYLQQKLGNMGSIWGRTYAERVGKDLLNRICFKIVTGFFLPTARETVGGSSYRSDRGWSFDDQLATNLGVMQDRRLGDYAQYEELAIIPQMIFSPVVINDGRRLYISGMPVTYLARSYDYNGRLGQGITGIDFRRYFRGQDADSLLFITAMRMNASFPLITPYVKMPSDPPMQLIDAGIADNFGLETAFRYLSVFSDWFKENTSGVLIIQIRDTKAQSREVAEYKQKNLLSQFFDPIGATYGAIFNTGEITSEGYLQQMDERLGGFMEYACFQYAPADSGGIKASLSWHLTGNEIEGIEASLSNDFNQKTFRHTVNWLKN
ncbi:MAG TPA: hypothetical protein ENJ82_11915 [Bacteroidetes bacterium]|nr:hypothetical protein [Bacteroidota bacterium]